MRYFADARGRFTLVIFAPPGTAPPPPGHVEIDSDTAVTCKLRGGQRLSAAQLAALQARSVSDFYAADSGDLATQDESSDQADTYAAIAERRSALGTSRTAHAPTAHQSSTYRRARKVAGTVEGVSWVFLVISVVLGIVVAAQTRVNGFTEETEHPNIAVGISIAVVGAFQALVVIMIATYIQARTEPPTN